MLIIREKPADRLERVKKEVKIAGKIESLLNDCPIDGSYNLSYDPIWIHVYPEIGFDKEKLLDWLSDFDGVEIGQSIDEWGSPYIVTNTIKIDDLKFVLVINYTKLDSCKLTKKKVMKTVYKVICIGD